MAANSVMVRPGARETGAPKRAGLTVNEIYEQLKQMAVLYKIRPGERVNELELAERFDVSRTPIREALNRLVAENLLTFVPNRGFFIRELDGKEVFDLFELRRTIESTAVMLACRTGVGQRHQDVAQVVEAGDEERGADAIRRARRQG